MNPITEQESSEIENLPATQEPRESETVANETQGTPTDVKQLTQTLLRQGYIEETKHAVDFRRAATQKSEINTALEPLDLRVKLDEARGIAFLVVAETGYDENNEAQEWSHPLVRRQRLTLEQSILVALLRNQFVLHEQDAGIGSSPPRIAVEELLQPFLTYFGDTGSDGKNQSRLTSALDQLKTCGIVSEVDKNEEITIRPLIAHFANPESLANLLRVLEEKASEAK